MRCDKGRVSLGSRGSGWGGQHGVGVAQASGTGVEGKGQAHLGPGREEPRDRGARLAGPRALPTPRPAGQLRLQRDREKPPQSPVPRSSGMKSACGFVSAKTKEQRLVLGLKSLCPSPRHHRRGCGPAPAGSPSTSGGRWRGGTGACDLFFSFTFSLRQKFGKASLHKAAWRRARREGHQHPGGSPATGPALNPTPEELKGTSSVSRSCLHKRPRR